MCKLKVSIFIPGVVLCRCFIAWVSGVYLYCKTIASKRTSPKIWSHSLSSSSLILRGTYIYCITLFHRFGHSVWINCMVPFSASASDIYLYTLYLYLYIYCNHRMNHSIPLTNMWKSQNEIAMQRAWTGGRGKQESFDVASGCRHCRVMPLV